MLEGKMRLIALSNVISLEDLGTCTSDFDPVTFLHNNCKAWMCVSVCVGEVYVCVCVENGKLDYRVFISLLTVILNAELSCKHQEHIT